MPRVSRPAAPASRRKHAREAGVAARDLVEDLPGVQRGERDLARAGQVEVVLGQVVDLLLGVGQEAGPEERLLADEHGRDDRLEAVAAQLVQRPLHERELEQHQVAAQVREARRREPRGALHVDPLAGEIEVVARPARRHRGLADLAQHRVAVGRLLVGQVRQRRERLAEAGLGVAELGLELPWRGRPPRASARSPRRRPRPPAWPWRSRRRPCSGALAAPPGRAGSRAGARRARAPGRRLAPPPARAARAQREPHRARAGSA